MRSAAGYTVRRPERADLPRLQELTREFWPDAPPEKLERRWWWNDPEPHCWVAVHDATGQMAAICGMRRASLLIDDSVVPTASVCDWDVSSQHKGKGLGRLLVDKTRETHPVMYAMSASDSAAVALGRLGWKGDVALSVMVGSPPLTAGLAAIRRSGQVTETYEVSASRHGGLSHLDAIWKLGPTQRPVMVVRHTRFMEAHLALVPHRTYQLVVTLAGSEPRGYGLFRVLPKGSFRRFGHTRIGMLSDFWVPDRDRASLRSVVGAAAAALTRSGVVVMLVLTTQRWVQQELALLGFASEETPLVGPKIKSLATRSMHSADRPLPDFVDGWHITFADNDMDLIFGSALET